MMRIVPVQPVPHISVLPRSKAILLRAVESVPDAFVVTDGEGDVITANAAFLEMVQLQHEKEVVGQPLDRWVSKAAWSSAC